MSETNSAPGGTPPVNPGPTAASASHPWVYSATITGDTISFRVEVTDVHTTAGAIEITGTATQVNGAFAPIYYITDVPSEPNGDPADDDEAGRYFVDVQATPTPGHVFDPKQDVTVFIRVSKVWVTVIGSGFGSRLPPANPPTWGVHIADSHIVAPDGGAVQGATIQAP